MIETLVSLGIEIVSETVKLVQDARASNEEAATKAKAMLEGTLDTLRAARSALRDGIVENNKLIDAEIEASRKK